MCKKAKETELKVAKSEGSKTTETQFTYDYVKGCVDEIKMMSIAATELWDIAANRRFDDDDSAAEDLVSAINAMEKRLATLHTVFDDFATYAFENM